MFSNYDGGKSSGDGCKAPSPEPKSLIQPEVIHEPGHLFFPVGLAVAAAALTPGLPVLRWGLGAAIGVWELWRITKRKALI